MALAASVTPKALCAFSICGWYTTCRIASTTTRTANTNYCLRLKSSRCSNMLYLTPSNNTSLLAVVTRAMACCIARRLARTSSFIYTQARQWVVTMTMTMTNLVLETACGFILFQQTKAVSITSSTPRRARHRHPIGILPLVWLGQAQFSGHRRRRVPETGPPAVPTAPKLATLVLGMSTERRAHLVSCWPHTLLAGVWTSL
mmetsp:Transcript_88382/g.143065  ORF Transcript_88382/g.143065 Transcript_88382/m.143065 type:complete len:202 (+) Transcript_88382:1244-1849(+)